MMMKALQIVLLMLVASLAAASTGPEDDLLRLCHHQPGLELTRISQVLAIIEQSKLVASGDCSEDIVNSLQDLEPILTAGLDDVCTIQKSQQILEYHKRHISLAKNEQAGVRAPEPLRRFFIGFGFRISQICKKNMINSLILDAQPKLTQEDFNKLKVDSKSSQSVLSILQSKPQDYDDIVLTGEVMQAVGSELSESKILIQAPTANMLRKIQVACKRRFKPFYERLIMPLIVLSNIGYNYQAEELEREIDELKSNNGVHTWYEIAFLCESVAGFEIADVPLDERPDATGQHHVIKILQGEEAEEARSKMHVSEGMISEELDAEVGPQIVYKPENGNVVPDVVIDKEDKVMMKLINKYDSQKSSLDRIRAKVLQKAASLIRDLLSRADITVVGSVFKSLRQQGDKMDLIEALDEHVREEIQGTQVDSAVAGFYNPMDFAKRMYHNTVFYGPTGLINKARKKDGGLTRSRFWKIVAVVAFIISILVAISCG